MRAARSFIALTIVAFISAVLLAGCGTAQLRVPETKLRAFAGAPKKPRLTILRVDDRSDLRYRDMSLFFSKLSNSPDVPTQLRSVIVRAAESSNLFAEVRAVETSSADFLARREEWKDRADLVLVSEMAVFSYEGGPKVVSFIVFPLWLLALIGIPAVPYEQRAELRLRARFVDPATGESKLDFDSDPIISQDPDFWCSYTNAPSHMQACLDRLSSRLLNSVFAALSPLGAGKKIEVDYPPETMAARADLHVNVAEDPRLAYLDVDINETRVARKDVRAEKSTSFTISVDLSKGTNLLSIAARDEKSEVITRVDLTIMRYK